MSIENEKTIEFYEKFAEDYRDRAKGGEYSKDRQDIHEWFKKVFSGVPKSAKIFEVGSGAGQDAEFLNKLGYAVQTSDVAESFIEILNDYNLNPVKFNIIKDDFDNKYDVILASAVLVHLTPSEVKNAIEKIYSALNYGGIFVLSVKSETRHEWKKEDPSGLSRYFSHWTQEEITGLLEKIGFVEVSVETFEGQRSNWLRIVAKKEEK